VSAGALASPSSRGAPPRLQHGAWRPIRATPRTGVFLRHAENIAR
jgi:hypothetical protein